MSNLQLDLLKAQDVEDWKNHIAWEEVIAPALARTKDLLTRQLVELSLGKKVEGITVEQVAGKIFGLDWFQQELTRITARGETAERILSVTPL